ncbi:ATP-binding protein [Nocardia panacis]|uniref:ATP-binding protein n=2 Tax=Nocardia panacis TaxID=2340916 RepID=A0A3A4KC47_9NOCA|nr:ATP-binding protein [Nocardia panacis]
MLPASERLPNAMRYISRGQYFVVHAPRQSGKTTTVQQMAYQLTATGKYAALSFSCEMAAPYGGDFSGAEQALLDNITLQAELQALPPECQPPTEWPSSAAGSALNKGLGTWARNCPRPLVLFFDEIDAMGGESLRSVLHQLRAGYTYQKKSFVHSIVLCGLRDVRDYKAASGGDPTRLGSASPFNINVESMRIADFTLAEVTELYRQHTAETGQKFTTRAIDLAYYYTQGQPWLVNSLAAEVIEQMRVETDITDDHIDEAKERLILARATHLDSLIKVLNEPRVQSVIEPIVAGTLPDVDPVFNDSIAYVRDLGLIAPTRPARIANPIYQEVIVRVLGGVIEEAIVAEPRNFRLPDGRLDFRLLLTEFANFWKQNGEIMVAKHGYHEVAPQLVMMAFLHRVVNGGGHIDREYGVGRGRIDLLIRQPYKNAENQRTWQLEALELKVWRDKQADPLATGLAQLDGYLDRLGLNTGVLVIFDRRSDAESIDKRTNFTTAASPAGREITLLRA